jgi:hypothetical protein
MATANSSLNIAELDFDQIKSNFKQYLKGQDKFNDYNFEGSVISQILDLLAYNTHYNAYYLNMIANEMFLDTSVKRGSVISHAKLLNYTPSSSRAATAVINVKFNGTTSPNFTIPKYTKFYSHAIDNVNYPFVTLEEVTVTTVNNSAQFNGVKIYQGQPVRYTYQVNTIQNPSLTFTLPDSDVDTTTLSVLVYDSSQSTTFNKFELSTSHLLLDNTTQVYFLQESLDGKYQIYFGDGILGKTLTTGNVITVEYLTTKGSAPNGAYKFTLMDKIGTYTGIIIDGTGIDTQVATGGNEKESIASIKYAAPKAYAAQNRAVTKSDYLELLKRDNPIVPIQAVNVWGGEEMNPPQYGKMFICIKPVGGYSITASQKYRLINEYIKPFGVITVFPEIVDIDYTFIKISSNILYYKNKSIFDPVALKNLLKLSILNFCEQTLNTFDSSFILPDLITTIKNVDKSIITSESTVSLQKRVLPIFNTFNSFTLEFGTPIKKGSLSSEYFDYVSVGGNTIIKNVQIEESPTVYNIIESLSIINGGAGYSSVPTITIYGDGTGATAIAELTNGSISNISIINQGKNYTQAVVVVSGGGGSGAEIVPVFSGNVVSLRSFYYNNNIKVILQQNIGEINYSAGVVKLNNFNPYQINNLLGYMAITVVPESTIFYSTKDKIITLDIMDDSAITLNVQSKA